MARQTVTTLSKADLKAQIACAEEELSRILDRAESLREYIAAARKLAGKKAPEYVQQSLPGVTVIPRRRTKGATLANNVAAILQDVGAPLHVRAIVLRLAEKGNPVIARNPINTVAVALARRTDQFKRTQPNTFDLVKRERQAAETA